MERKCDVGRGMGLRRGGAWEEEEQGRECCGNMDAEDARGMPAGWVRSSVVGRGTATRRKCAHMIPFFFSAYYIRTARFFADEIPFTKTESLTSRITATWLARSLCTTSLSRRKAHRGWKSARFVHSRWLVSIRIPRNKTKKNAAQMLFSCPPFPSALRTATLRCAALLTTLPAD